MPRDKRFFMTFPNDFPWHPKVTRLSVAARWAFVEMNGYSRVRDLDGIIPQADAEFEWTPDVLAELLGSHPTRPLVLRNGDGDYVIREYPEHQQTKAERERLAEVSRENGRKGGRPPKNPKETQPGSAQVPKEPSGKQSQESRVQSSETTYVHQSSYVPERETPVDTTSRSTLQSFGLEADGLRTLIHQHTGRELSPAGALRVTVWLLEKGRNVKKPGAYVKRCLASSAFEVQQYIDEEVLA